MYEMICNACRQMEEKHRLPMIPAGDVLQAAGEDKFFNGKEGISLYRDGGHLSLPAGRYLAGLAWFRYLLRGEVGKVAFVSEGLSEDAAALLKEYCRK